MNYTSINEGDMASILREKILNLERAHYIATLDLKAIKAQMLLDLPGAAENVVDITQRITSIEASLKALG